MNFKIFSPDDEYHDAGKSRVYFEAITSVHWGFFLKLGSCTDTWAAGLCSSISVETGQQVPADPVTLLVTPQVVKPGALLHLGHVLFCVRIWFLLLCLTLGKRLHLGSVLKNISFYSKSGEVWDTSEDPFEPWSLDPRDWSGDRRVQTEAQRAHGILSNGHWPNVREKCKITLPCTNHSATLSLDQIGNTWIACLNSTLEINTQNHRSSFPA